MIWKYFTKKYPYYLFCHFFLQSWEAVVVMLFGNQFIMFTHYQLSARSSAIIQYSFCSSFSHKIHYTQLIFIWFIWLYGWYGCNLCNLKVFNKPGQTSKRISESLCVSLPKLPWIVKPNRIMWLGVKFSNRKCGLYDVL